MIVDMLMGQIGTTKNLRCGGCAMLLPFWFVEHTNLVTHVCVVGFPCFMKWDLGELHMHMGLTSIVDLENEIVFDKKLEGTPREKDKIQERQEFWQEKIEE